MKTGEGRGSNPNSRKNLKKFKPGESGSVIEMSNKRLTQKQETFCVKYFELGNATEAALVAGYSPKYCANNTPKLLNNTKIQARIQELRQKVEDDSVMNVLERKQILTEIARADMTNFVEVGQDGAWFNIDETNLNSRAIQSVQSRTVLGKEGADDAVFIRVNLHDPTKAIDLLNKMDKIYQDGTTVNIDNRTIEIHDAKGKLISAISRLAARESEIKAIAGP